MTTTEQITNVATALGWSVKRTPVVPASRSSSSGSTRPQDRTSASASKCGTAILTASCKSLEKYYEAYDSDYEAYLWIGTDGHGKNGALTTSKTS